MSTSQGHASSTQQQNYRGHRARHLILWYHGQCVIARREIRLRRSIDEMYCKSDKAGHEFLDSSEVTGYSYNMPRPKTRMNAGSNPGTAMQDVEKRTRPQSSSSGDQKGSQPPKIRLLASNAGRRLGFMLVCSGRNGCASDIAIAVKCEEVTSWDFESSEGCYEEGGHVI
ncbi:hypothetical protein E4U12_002993 [Claviceps purpurea]|nr:hypothetical protein E4U12_002993 [Claviceps purpurea]